jgi:adenosyl cobinamide kinase/adenosyl cobinamide phosphate guanylyltransferase
MTLKTLILGGVRSGKSRLAETLALQSGLPVTYVATAIAGDEEMRRRIELHRQRRPAAWTVVEEPPIELNQDLREMHFGAWEGRTAAHLAVIDGEALTRFWQNPIKYTPPGAETLAQLQSRTLRTLKAVLTQYRHQRLLLITHGGPIRILLCQALGKPIEKSLQIEVPPASLHRLRVHADAEGTMQVD